MKPILIILALTFSTTAAFPHPGRTDSKGGHKQNGKYHLHKKPADPAKKDAPKKKK